MPPSLTSLTRTHCSCIVHHYILRLSCSHNSIKLELVQLYCCTITSPATLAATIPRLKPVELYCIITPLSISCPRSPALNHGNSITLGIKPLPTRVQPSSWPGHIQRPPRVDPAPDKQRVHHNPNRHETIAPRIGDGKEISIRSFPRSRRQVHQNTQDDQHYRDHRNHNVPEQEGLRREPEE